MSRTANRVLTVRRDIDRIEGLIVALPGQARVRITLCNGDVISGTVVDRPAVQVFEDAAGNQGVNSVVRIDDPSASPWHADVWLSDIDRVEHLIGNN